MTCPPHIYIRGLGENAWLCAYCDRHQPADMPMTTIRNDPRPSEVDAAERALPRSGTDRKRILDLIRAGIDIGRTIAEHMQTDPDDPRNISPNQVMTRIGELRAHGHVTELRRDGQIVYGKTSTGTKATRWTAT